jgi:hypothetical protein
MTTPTPASVTNRKANSGTTPSPVLLRQLGEVLTRQSCLLIDMILPGSSRVYRPTVFLANTETASTNGTLWIRMPIDFLGLHYPSERVAAAPVWLGLLGHEFAHWLQPLDEMDKAGKELNVPHWLVNVLLDIHGEALVAGLFPGLHGPLVAQRAHIGRAMARKYQRGVREADSFPAALSTLVLYYRFCCGKHQWSYYPFDGPPASMRNLAVPVAERVKDCALAMVGIVDVPTKDLPKFLKELVGKFPELVLPPGEKSEGDGLGEGQEGGLEQGGSSTSSGGGILPVLKRMLGNGLPGTPAGDAQRYTLSSEEKVGAANGIRPPSAAAVRLANTLTVRFKTPKGMLSVPAPGRLDRIAALHQDPMPFRLELPSRFSGQPSPKVVLLVDRSGSMGNGKWERALLAAQAIAMAIRRAGGDVRVVIFNDDFYHAPDYNADVLFASSLAGISMLSYGGGTSFTWLPTVWMQFPDYVHILLTDGDGAIPVLVPAMDRRRTFAIVIPDGTSDQIAPIAAKVVVVNDLSRLPGVFAFLAPRQWVG